MWLNIETDKDIGMKRKEQKGSALIDRWDHSSIRSELSQLFTSESLRALLLDVLERELYVVWKNFFAFVFFEMSLEYC